MGRNFRFCLEIRLGSKERKPRDPIPGGSEEEGCSQLGRRKRSRRPTLLSPELCLGLVLGVRQYLTSLVKGLGTGTDLETNYNQWLEPRKYLETSRERKYKHKEWVKGRKVFQKLRSRIENSKRSPRFPWAGGEDRVPERAIGDLHGVGRRFRTIGWFLIV